MGVAHPSLLSLLYSLLGGLWERRRGSSCRGWSREGRKAEGVGSSGLPSCSGTWVHQAGWISSWDPAEERQDSFRGPGMGLRIGKIPTGL